jgi:L-iditol 2-dehydrogenase
MRALLLKEYKTLAVTDMPEPAAGPHDVLVRVKACGICGSDVHGYDGSTGRRIPPVVMGHEASGIVVGTGKQVTRFRVGDRVTFDSTVYCGRCYFCGRGEINLCDDRQVLGASAGEYRRNGAFAEYIAVPEHIVYALPDLLTFEQGAMIEAVSVAVHAVGLTPVKLNDTAVVVGSGMIGLLVIQALRLAGCGRIIAVDVNDTRLKLAMEYGADLCLNAGESDIPAEVRAHTSGRGADVGIEVVGTSETLRSAAESLRKGGALTLVGNVSPKVEFPLQWVVTRQIRVIDQRNCAPGGRAGLVRPLVQSGTQSDESDLTAVGKWI